MLFSLQLHNFPGSLNIVSKNSTFYLISLLHYNCASIEINALESSPDHINGQLLACVGDRISLTCSRDFELDTGIIYWTFRSPTIYCDLVIQYFRNFPVDCGPFMVRSISRSSTFLSSSITVAIANASMSSVVIQCSTSNIPQLSMPIGSKITLCIPGKI